MRYAAGSARATVALALVWLVSVLAAGGYAVRAEERRVVFRLAIEGAPPPADTFSALWRDPSGAVGRVPLCGGGTDRPCAAGAAHQADAVVEPGRDGAVIYSFVRTGTGEGGRPEVEVFAQEGDPYRPGVVYAASYRYGPGDPLAGPVRFALRIEGTPPEGAAFAVLIHDMRRGSEAILCGSEYFPTRPWPVPPCRGGATHVATVDPHVAVSGGTFLRVTRVDAYGQLHGEQFVPLNESERPMSVYHGVYRYPDAPGSGQLVGQERPGTHGAVVAGALVVSAGLLAAATYAVLRRRGAHPTHGHSVKRHSR